MSSKPFLAIGLMSDSAAAESADHFSEMSHNTWLTPEPHKTAAIPYIG